MKKAKNIIAAILAVLLLIIVIQNTETVETQILFATIALPRALLLFISLTAGVVIGLVLGLRLSGSPK